MMKKAIALILSLAVCIALLCGMAVSAYADGQAAEEATEETTAEATTEDGLKRTKAIAAAAIVGVVAAAGALGMAFSIGKSADNMARQPEAADKINSAMMLGLVFIETAIIYALIIAILIIFVL